MKGLNETSNFKKDTMGLSLIFWPAEVFLGEDLVILIKSHLRFLETFSIKYKIIREYLFDL